LFDWGGFCLRIGRVPTNALRPRRFPAQASRNAFPALDDAQSSALLFAITINDLDRSIQDVLLPEIRDRFQFGPDTSHAKGLMDRRFLLTFSCSGVVSPQMWWALPWDVLIV